MSKKFNLLSNAAALFAKAPPGASADSTPTPTPTPVPTPLVVPPVDPAPAAGSAADDDAPVDVVPAEVALEAAATARAEGITAGADAERKRTNAVLTSPEGQANTSTACFMLNANPSATSEQIVAHLKTMPVQAAAAAKTPALTTSLDQTPALNLGAPAANGSDGTGGDEPNGEQVWKDVQARATRGAMAGTDADKGAMHPGGH